MQTLLPDNNELNTTSSIADTSVDEEVIQPGNVPGCITISVRSLVEFVLRNGDIDNRHKGWKDVDAMQEGAAAHRAIQRRMGGEYLSEVTLTDVRERDAYDIIVEGRADGIILTDPVTIDEIKSTAKRVDLIKEPDILHLAQAKCYAYMYAVQNDLTNISVRITYVERGTLECRYFYEDHTIKSITKWYEDLMEKYYPWADFAYYWKGVRNAGISQLKFPFEYRPGQRELVAQVYRSILNKEKLFLEAPTGVGKTISTVYPALKAMGEGRCEKIFYLTAKTITRTVAAECLDLLRQQPLSFKSIILTAKEKICPLNEPDCNPDTCAFAKGHFDRINDAIYDLLTHSDNFTREAIEACSIKHRVCPFELSLDLSLFSDAVICDYNYAFDPNVYLKRYFGAGVGGKYFFLVDEAHNLSERAMSMYSAVLYKEQFLEVRRIVKSKDETLAKYLNNANKVMLSYKRECSDVERYETIAEFFVPLNRIYSRLNDFLERFEKFDERDAVLNFFFDLRHFMNMYENMGRDDYVIYTQLLDDGRFMLKLMCADPSRSLRRCTDKADFTVFFSATLLPITYYRKMLGADETDPAVYAKSVFDPQRRGLFVARDVTSRYTRRSKSEYERMAEYIHKAVSAKQGNYLIFCPSHAMLQRVSEIYLSGFYDSETEELIIQNPSMGEEDREDFLNRFESGRDRTLLGFCVLGGIFSEGIDLKRESLIGAIIIGTGLPLVCNERGMLKERYDSNGLEGFAYAYRYPGMNKVLQAAGRVIRTVEDTGIVVLLDERFLDREYLSMFPREWMDYIPVNIDTVHGEIVSFWEKIC